MIAPFQEPETVERDAARSLRKARRAIAGMLLSPEKTPSHRQAVRPNWRHWLLAAWIITVAASYFVLSGWWQLGLR